MKTNFKTFLFVITLITFIVSCNKGSDVQPIPDEAVVDKPIEEEVAMGTVSLNTIVKDIVEVQTSKAPPTLDAVLDDLYVEIYNGPIAVLQSEFRDLPEFIELPSGLSYDIYLYTPMPNSARLDVGRYGGNLLTSFSIVEGQNSVVDIVLNLWDVATTIDFSDEVLLNYPAIKGRVYVNYDDTSTSTPLDWLAVDDSRTGFINLIEGLGGGIFFVRTGNLIVEISALDSANNEILVSKTYPNVTANQHYNITVSYAGASTSSLNISLGEEEVIEDTITFPN